MSEYSVMDDILTLSLAEAATTIEVDRQKEVLLVRRYYQGDQEVELTERQEQFLGDESRDGPSFCVNLVKSVIDVVVERLHVKGFDCTEPEQALLAWEWWTKNKLDASQEDVHELALRDGESFVVVDWDEEKQIPVAIPHQRWTDTSTGGDDFGCWVSYPDNDPNQEPKFAVKQWVEKTDKSQIERRNVYYPGHIDKYVRGGLKANWTLLSSDPWLAADGTPLGIPVIAFRTRGLRSEVWEALPMQDVVNKSVVDLVNTTDMTAFRIFYALGFIPTDDGKEPADDGSNWLKIAPGKIIGTTRSRDEVSFGAIEAADPEPLMKAAQQFMLWMAMLSGTPTARFTTWGGLAAKETLKEQEGPLMAKVESHQVRFGNSWEQMMYIMRRLYNARSIGTSPIDEEVMFEALWVAAGHQDENARIEMLVLKRELGIPLPQLWKEAGYSSQQVEEMKKTEEYRRMLISMGPDPNEEASAQTNAPAADEQSVSMTEEAQDESTTE